MSKVGINIIFKVQIEKMIGNIRNNKGIFKMVMILVKAAG